MARKTAINLMQGAFVMGGLLVASPVAAGTLRCDIATKNFCDADHGCNVTKAGVHNLIDLTLKTFARCDSMGCDTYDAEITKSGSFSNIDVPGRGVVAKLNEIDGSFVEIVTLMTQVYVSFGKCQ